MINSKKELNEYLKYEKSMYLISKQHYLGMLLKCDQDLYIWKYLFALRHLEYNLNNGNKIRALYWERKKNKLGVKIGIYIHPNCVEKGLRIWHIGNIIIHKDAIIGSDCQLHGFNCIGNKGIACSGVPIIGNRVNIGVGAIIIGPVTIADDITVAANAVVTHSISEKSSILAGIPAKKIN